ncbi:unnamed protein product, partial [Mesorhabditis spiculigera]
MRISLLLLTLPAILVAYNPPASECDQITLVKCFIDILDDWAWTLYELKQNVVTISDEQCKHLSRLETCVNDDISPEDAGKMQLSQNKHKCKHSEVVEVSETVSDLLTHRQKAGSFLKSYYLLKYACSTEGQEILREHRECLKNERIGDMTLKAGTYMATKFLDSPNDGVCAEIQQQLDEYMETTSGLCQAAASRLMCKSLTNMFTELHRDALSDCEFKCPEAKEAPKADTNTLEDPQQEQSDQEALNKAKGSALSTITQSAGLLLAFIFLR